MWKWKLTFPALSAAPFLIVFWVLSCLLIKQHIFIAARRTLIYCMLHESWVGRKTIPQNAAKDHLHRNTLSVIRMIGLRSDPTCAQHISTAVIISLWHEVGCKMIFVTWQQRTANTPADSARVGGFFAGTGILETLGYLGQERFWKAMSK